ncbi:AfsR/SARP family transcriptional regulator [Streptomyces mayteni]
MELLLAALLSRSGQMVTMGQLCTELWGERAPRRAATSLHVYISQLRKFLGRPRQSESPIVTRSPGYVIQIGSDEFDALDFQRGVEEGRTHALIGEREKAVRSFEEALGLWRGPALDEIRDGPIVHGFVTWLDELRVECAEMLVEAYLQMGRYRDVIPRLQQLLVENPLREVFYRHLMLALYRTDRRAEALDVYQLARRRLNDELGLEPCRSLRELQQCVLADDGAEHVLLVGEGLLGQRL